MSTAGGRSGKCIVTSAESKPLNTSDCECVHGSLAHLNTEPSGNDASSANRSSPNPPRRRSRVTHRNSHSHRANSRSKRRGPRSRRMNSGAHATAPRRLSLGNRSQCDSNDIETVRQARSHREESRRLVPSPRNCESRARAPIAPKREIEYGEPIWPRRSRLRTPTPTRCRQRQYRRSVDYLEPGEGTSDDKPDRSGNEVPNEPLRQEDFRDELSYAEKFDGYTASG